MQVPWASKVSFLYSREPLCNKILRQKRASLQNGIRKKRNLELLWKNYCRYNKIYMFLEYLIPKRMFDMFSIVFQESTFENSI